MSWKWNWKTGYSYVSPPIQSNSSVTKVKGPLGSEEWGPYKKIYIKSSLGQNLFTPPESVDGVPILCRCRQISEYMRSNSVIPLGAGGALLFGSNRPACWDDSETIMNPSGGETFKVTIGDPGFYAYGVNKDGLAGFFWGGKRKTRRKGRALKKSRKVKRLQK